jgi:glycosyltransferase involved in cell wall biosynthesis
VAVSVVVPTHRRPEQLRKCLDGLRLQSHVPTEVIVVRRDDDQAARSVLSEFLIPGLCEIEVSEPGVLAAMTAGSHRASGDVIAFTDDDAVPRPDWLTRMLQHFDDPAVGGVGGRDLIHSLRLDAPLTADVGRISKWGKVIGNHHRGRGPARTVMVLKGVNLAFRREALALPSSLRGRGAQAHWEVAACLWAQHRKWKLVYDPAILVDHFPAPREGGDHRIAPPAPVVADSEYNLVATLLSFEPRLFWRRALYGLMVGARGDLGMGRALWALLHRDWDLVTQLLPSLRGQIEALRDVVRGNRIAMVVFAPSRWPRSPEISVA